MGETRSFYTVPPASGVPSHSDEELKSRHSQCGNHTPCCVTSPLRELSVNQRTRPLPLNCIILP